MLRGTAAFPVSAGLIREKGSEETSPFPNHGVMFIANDPDSVENYNECAKSGFSNGDREQPKLMRYWAGVYSLLDLVAARGAKLSRSECFFTNVYAALREGRKNTGGSRRYSKFLDWCIEFLSAQISMMTPRLIVVFRREACKSVGIIGNEKPDLRVCDTRIGAHINTMVRNVPIVCLWHPSRRPYPGYSSQEVLDNDNAVRLTNALRDTKGPF